MKNRVLWALLTLVILLSACGQIEKNVPDVPSSPQEVVEDAPSFISNEITTSETEQDSEVLTPEQFPENKPELDSQDPTSNTPTEQENAVIVPSPVEVESIQEPESQLTTEPESEAPPTTDLPSDSPPVQESAPPQEISTLPILMYHHVVPDGTACNSMTVTGGKLAEDLAWLKEHGYTTVLPRELAAGMPLPEKPVLITFDDGYRSNYDLAYPLLQQYQSKAVISIMVFMQEAGVTSSLSWDMCREMSDSDLIEIGSHTYRLHNLDERNGNFTPGGINGIQRKPEESDEDFSLRVLDDIQKSHDLIAENLGRDVTFFAYPFGIREPDAQELIDTLFPITVVTATGSANISNGYRNMTRWTVTMNTPLSSILKA